MSNLILAFKTKAVLIDVKLNKAHIAKQKNHTEANKTRYYNLYWQSIDAWTSYWRMVDLFKTK